MKIAVASRKLGVDRVGEKSLTAFGSRSSVRTTRFSDKKITVTFVWQTELSGRHLRGFCCASIVLLSETPSRYANYRGRVRYTRRVVTTHFGKHPERLLGWFAAHMCSALPKRAADQIAKRNIFLL